MSVTRRYGCVQVAQAPRPLQRHQPAYLIPAHAGWHPRVQRRLRPLNMAETETGAHVAVRQDRFLGEGMPTSLPAVKYSPKRFRDYISALANA